MPTSTPHGGNGGTSDGEYVAAHAHLLGASRKPHRAVAFGGGGPAVGISVGFLKALQDFNDQKEQAGQPQRRIDFDVWVAGCVGGWLTCLYHLAGKDATRVEAQMKAFFRDDRMYEHFPAPMTFTPDIPEQIVAGLNFLVDPRYRDPAMPIHLAQSIAQCYQEMVQLFLTRGRWSYGDFCYLMLNAVMAPNPAARLLMSLLYKTPITGLNKLWFGPGRSGLLDQFDLEKLREPGVPPIYINSYNLERKRSDLYCNHPAQSPVPTGKLTMDALCASSALPYVFAPVEVDGELHCEGALLDSFCFEAVYRNHDHINEVWISQIVDHKQVRPPANLLDALNNLIMLYAGTTSRNDIETFVNYLNREEYVQVRLNPQYEANYIECFQLPVPESTEYYWSYTNYENSVRASRNACAEYLRNYDLELENNGERKPRFLNSFIRKQQWFSDVPKTAAPRPPANAAASDAPRRRRRTPSNGRDTLNGRSSTAS